MASSPGRKDSKRIQRTRRMSVTDMLTDLLKKRNLKIETSYYHAVNLAGVHKYLYLTCRSSKSERFDAEVLDK
jgi:hypothetical protein